MRTILGGENAALVPAGTPLVPLVVRDGRPVRIGDVVTLNAGERRNALFTPPAPGTGDVVAWLRFEAEFAKNLEPGKSIGAPHIALVSRKGEHDALLPVTDAPSSHLAFIFFRGVPAGPARVTARGDLWETAELSATVESGEVTVLGEPLPIAPAGAVTLRWRIDDDPARLTAGETCDGPAAAKATADAKRTLRIVRCSGEAADDCRVHFRQELAAGATAGTASVASLTTGLYTAELQVPPLAPVRQEIYVEVRRAVEVDLVAAPAAVYGLVTRGGKPVRASLSLAGHSFMSGESGAFSAVVPGAAGAGAIEVKPCDTRQPFVYHPAAPLEANSFLTIDIPHSALEVSVVDRETEKTLDDAKVSLVVSHSGQAEAKTVMALQHDPARSLYVLSPYAPREARVCASAVGHEMECVEVRGGSAPAEPVVIALRGRRGTPGRVVSGEPIADGLLYVVSPAGDVLQRSQIGKDGAFDLPSLPPPGAYFVLTARNQPLSLLAPQQGSGELTLTRPQTPLRNFAVQLGPTGNVERGRIAISLGAVRIPIEAFEHHQQLRGWPPLFERTRAYFVGDVAEAGAISAQLVPVGMDDGNGRPLSGSLPPDNDLLIFR